MSRLNDLIRQVALTNEALAADLQREISALADRRSFGLNFERHVPETVELPGRPVRRGDKVRMLLPRGQTSTAGGEELWQVDRIDRSGEEPVAGLVGLADASETAMAAVEDLVVVAEFRDPIYPGLVSTSKIERGGDKPYHTVINAENYHALQTLLFSHRGKVDAIYIDPPYNTGARDWKYNNDFVDADDLYRHSKWLAFMERRLILAKSLLNPRDSVLIVTIDEREVYRLGLLIQQTFPEASTQMATIVINHRGVARNREFTRVEEYAFFVFLGSAGPALTSDDLLTGEPNDSNTDDSVRWERLIKGSNNARRQDRPNLFYPVFIDPATKRIVNAGPSIPLDFPRGGVKVPDGLVAVWPLARDSTEKRWQLAPETFMSLAAQGMAKVGAHDEKNDRWSILYLNRGQVERIRRGEIIATGRDANGALQLAAISLTRAGKTVWNRASHNAGYYGSGMLADLIPGRRFPFPKSLYAVEDTLRFAVANKPSAIVLDFFAGSGTTAHAVMRLNHQDSGRRQCISVTNNEVSAEEQLALRKRGLRPGDADWEQRGICDHVTKPRIQAAIMGQTPAGDPVGGDYKFTDEFPIADGFEENVAFFSLTYEAPLRVAGHRDFERIAPLLWLRAGSRGRRIDDVRKGWDVAEAYGVLADLDQIEPFLKALAEKGEVEIVFVRTDEDRLFESVVRELPEHVEPVRLYEAYLRNSEIESGRGLR